MDKKYLNWFFRLFRTGVFYYFAHYFKKSTVLNQFSDGNYKSIQRVAPSG